MDLVTYSSKPNIDIDPIILQDNPFINLVKTIIPEDNREPSSSRKRTTLRVLGPAILLKRDRSLKTSKLIDNLALNL